MSETSDKIEKSSKELAAQSKMFNISSWAKGKVESKRRKRGLGELTPRQNNSYMQMLSYSTSICISKTLFAPIDRIRFIS